MDIYRTFLAIILSFIILIGYQYFFVGFGPGEEPVEDIAAQTATVMTDTPAAGKAVIAATPVTAAASAAARGDGSSRQRCEDPAC